MCHDLIARLGLTAHLQLNGFVVMRGNAKVADSEFLQGPGGHPKPASRGHLKTGHLV